MAEPDFRRPVTLSTNASAGSTAGHADAKEFIASFDGGNEEPVTIDLPVSHLMGIARVVSYWALQEWMLIGTICMLLGINRKEGRIAVGQPRSEQSLDRIKQLLQAKNLTITADLSRLRARLREGKEARDLVGHGVWVMHNGRLCVQNTAGEWKFGNKEPNPSKRLYPEAKYVDDAWFDEWATKVTESIGWTQEMDEEIERALAP